MCNSNPLLEWPWAGGVTCEFRGDMCTSFLCMRLGERQVFAGDFRHVLKLQSAFQRWITFVGTFEALREKRRGEYKWSTDVCVGEEYEQV